jgi:hypothetical protein
MGRPMSRVGRLLLWMKAPPAVKRFDALCRTPAQAQDRLLRKIVGANADTEFGHRLGVVGTCPPPPCKRRRSS